MGKLKTNLKAQLDAISTKVTEAEKAATKQIKSILKNTEDLRSKQMKNVQGLIKKARALRDTTIVQRAETLGKNIESQASAGFEILLTKLKVSTKADVDRLSKRLSQLQKRLDELEKNSKSTSN